MILADSAFKAYYNEAKLFLIGSFAVLSISYLSLEFFFNSVTAEVAASWYASEKLSIQQGNLLSSVGKIQRIIQDSKILKGVSVVDEGNIEVVGFGHKFERPNVINAVKDTPSVIWVGPFKRVHVITTDRHKILLFSSSSALIFVFIFIILYLLIIASWLSIRFKKELTQKLHLENEVIIRTIQTEAFIAEERAKIATQIAHDIRSPISSLNIIFGTIESSFEKKSLINASIKRINDIANDLLAFNKTGLVEVEKDQSYFIEKFCLNKIFEMLIEEKRTQFSENSLIKIVFNANENYFSRIPVIEFTRAMSNLLNNSLEAVVDGGVVTISINSVKNKLRIVLEDTGYGIDPELIDLVLQGFSTKQGGYGLGLSSANNLLKKIGGTLEIESKQLVGTIVKMELPNET